MFVLIVVKRKIGLYFRMLDLEKIAVSRMEMSSVDSLLRDHALVLCLLPVLSLDLGTTQLDPGELYRVMQPTNPYATSITPTVCDISGLSPFSTIGELTR